MLMRLAFCFHNPNHAAALICALLPLCWGWRRTQWVGLALSAALLVALLLTQSRTGVLVAGVEAMAWWWISRIGTAASSRPPYRRWFPWILGGYDSVVHGAAACVRRREDARALADTAVWHQAVRTFSRRAAK